MNYLQLIKNYMERLSKDPLTRFIGYNLKYGSKAYGTLVNVPSLNIIEMPIAENLMAGISIGMALEGFKPVLIFERHDFMLNSLDSLVNHLDKLETLSNKQYKAPMIIRAIVGSKKPINPGPQHSQDFTKPLRNMLNFPIYDPKNTKELSNAYEEGVKFKNPVMIIERRELYPTS